MITDKPRGVLNFVSFECQTFPRWQSWTSSGNCKEEKKNYPNRSGSWALVCEEDE